MSSLFLSLDHQMVGFLKNFTSKIALKSILFSPSRQYHPLLPCNLSSYLVLYHHVWFCLPYCLNFSTYTLSKMQILSYSLQKLPEYILICEGIKYNLVCLTLQLHLFLPASSLHSPTMSNFTGLSLHLMLSCFWAFDYLCWNHFRITEYLQK